MYSWGPLWGIRLRGLRFCVRTIDSETRALHHGGTEPRRKTKDRWVYASRDAQKIRQPAAKAAAQGEFLAADERNDVFACRPGFQFADAPAVDNHGPVNPHEVMVLQLFFKPAQRVAYRIAFLPRMNANVVAGSFKIVDAVESQKDSASALLHRQPPTIAIRVGE